MKIYIKNWIESVLSIFFSPKVGKLHEWSPPCPPYAEQGSCGKAQPKKFKDAIERHWAEESEIDEAMERLAAKKGRFEF